MSKTAKLTRRGFLIGTGVSAFAAAASAQDMSFLSRGKDNNFSSIEKARIPDNPHDAHWQEMLSGSAEPVAVRLALLFDCSTTVDESEFRLQMAGAADALISEQVKQALFLGPRAPESIALCVLTYSQGAKMIMPWVDIRSEEPNHIEKLHAVSDHVRNLDRAGPGNTYISAGLDAAGSMFDMCMWGSSERDVADVFGDGRDDAGPIKLRQTSDRLSNAGIRVNGFAVDRPDMSLTNYFNEHLVTPRPIRVAETGRLVEPGFVITALTAREGRADGSFTYRRDQAAIDLGFRKKLKWEVV